MEFEALMDEKFDVAMIDWNLLGRKIPRLYNNVANFGQESEKLEIIHDRIVSRLELERQFCLARSAVQASSDHIRLIEWRSDWDSFPSESAAFWSERMLERKSINATHDIIAESLHAHRNAYLRSIYS